MENADDPLVKCSDSSLRSTHVAAYDYAGLNEALLTNKVMLFAYAASIIIVAIGCVGLLITIGVLCFFYPDKGTAFFNALVVIFPVIGLLIANFSKIKSASKTIANGNTKS